jgi:predicted DNA-binding transcriptional regulator AlpA
MLNLENTLSAAQVKKLLGISEATLHRLRNEHQQLHAIKIGGAAVFDIDEVNQVLRERIRQEIMAERNR